MKKYRAGTQQNYYKMQAEAAQYSNSGGVNFRGRACAGDAYALRMGPEKGEHKIKYKIF